MEGIKRAWIGFTLHLLTVLFFFIWPIYVVVRYAIADFDEMKELPWTFFLNLTLMIFVGLSLVWGLHKPLSRWVRLSVGTILGAGAFLWIFDLIFQVIQGDEFDYSIPASLVVSTLIALGMFMGYDSKVAFLLLPFQADKDAKKEHPEHYGSQRGESPV